MFNLDVESKISERERARTANAAKRAKLKFSEREPDPETHTCVSPNDRLALERHKAVCDYYIGIYERQCERERQERIAEANPKLIAWKTEYMQDKTTPSRRAALVSQFVELYRQAYRKDVPVEVLAKEWNEIRRRAALKKLCAAATGETK